MKGSNYVENIMYIILVLGAHTANINFLFMYMLNYIIDMTYR